MSNYHCRKCGRYVRQEEEHGDMRVKKLCTMCVWENSTPKRSIFQAYKADW